MTSIRLFKGQANVSLWEHFCAWITSTDNRLYLGWFVSLMITTYGLNKGMYIGFYLRLWLDLDPVPPFPFPDPFPDDPDLCPDPIPDLPDPGPSEIILA